MQTFIQCSSLYTFIHILDTRDGAGVGSFHHYVPILCITTDVLTSEVVSKIPFGHQSWAVDYGLQMPLPSRYQQSYDGL